MFVEWRSNNALRVNLDKLVAFQYSSMKDTIKIIRYRLKAIELLFVKVPSGRDAFFVLVVCKRQRILNSRLVFQMVAKIEHELEPGGKTASWKNKIYLRERIILFTKKSGALSLFMVVYQYGAISPRFCSYI